MTSTNPLYPSQWHLSQIGGVETVWQDYTGNGVIVAVYDDGVEVDHSDLAENFNDTSLNFSNDDGLPNSDSDRHGTAVAGIIAASNNGIGGVGVAWGASLVSLDYLGDLQSSFWVSYNALRWASNFDVVNFSWGRSADYSSSNDIGDTYSATARDVEALEYAIETGRDGLGTIIVKAAGNDSNDASSINDAGLFGNAQGEGLNSSHYIITVGATSNGGSITNYSSYGHNLLISAPAASVTTDLSGSAGYGRGDTTSTFGGTSAATPVISGVVALILEAAPQLGWRDVQNILALSAAQTGSTFGQSRSGYEVSSWSSNDASNWNGGGLTFNPSYGYGQVDVLAAVRLAEIWGLLYDEAAVSSNEEVVTASSTGSAKFISDNSTVSMSITVTENIAIEHLYVTVDARHTYSADLTVTLISPDGQRHEMFDREGLSTEIDDDFTFGLTNFRGMDSGGVWQVEIQDSAFGNTGTLEGIHLEFRGSAASTDTEWVFTNDFQMLANTENNRRLINDTDGGDDVLVLAAVTGDVSVSLQSGGVISVAGSEWATLANDAIENVILGDGADNVTGNDRDNILYGGRGDDTLNGGSGNDTLNGGIGDDTLEGGSGRDTLLGGAGDDLLNSESVLSDFDQIASQVYRLYRATLDRDPDAQGHQDWISNISSGQQTLTQATAGFVNSAEFQNTYGDATNAQFVTLLYNNVLDRDPDAAGLADWLTHLDSGRQTREQVVLGFSESLEFQDITIGASLTYSWAGYQANWTDNVFRLYQATLNREPDAGGLDNWTTVLAGGQTLQGVVSGFVNSLEFQNTYGDATNTQFVTLLYNNVLDRDPDAAGLADWLEHLDSGSQTREQVVLGFSESLEFIDTAQDELVTFMRGLGEDDQLSGGTGSNLLFGGAGSDTFVFNASQAGTHRVAGLEAWDMIELQQFTFADADAALAALTQANDHVILTQGAISITFENTVVEFFEADMIAIV